MARRQLMVLTPVLGLSGIGWMLINPGIIRGADKRIVAPAVSSLEKEMKTHIYAPTWLPQSAGVGSRGVLRGQFRVLQDFDTPDGQLLALMAQETRTPERDRYHQRIFAKKSEARADINGSTGHLVTGSNGERRLFWNHQDTALILSSTRLADEDLVRIARQVQ